MRHKWVINNTMKPDEGWPKLVKEWICSVCGMKKSKYVAKNYSSFMYDRSGQVFRSGYPPPDCIDWNEENNKTID